MSRFGLAAQRAALSLPATTTPAVLDEGKKKWIQSAFKDVHKRGTEGVCTGEKFGGPTCPPGSKRYNMAKNLRKLSHDK